MGSTDSARRPLANFRARRAERMRSAGVAGRTDRRAFAPEGAPSGDMAHAVVDVEWLAQAELSRVALVYAMGAVLAIFVRAVST